MSNTVYLLTDLATMVYGEINGDSQQAITGVAPLESAKNSQLTYLIGGSYRKFLKQTQAGAVLLKKEFVADCPVAAIVVKNPEASFAKIAELFVTRSVPSPGIHSSVIAGSFCHIDETASIGPGCIIGDRVSIGKNTIIMAGTIIGDDVVIGDDCLIYANVTIYYGVRLANRIILHSGVVIGADGFGYTNQQGTWIKIPQLGGVNIGNDVEIGANSTIDRGALVDTQLHEGVKIDNQVQIGHNVEIGAHSIIAGSTGVAGSATIGKYCMIGGGCLIGGHITLGDGVCLTGGSGVSHSISTPGSYSSGINVRPSRQWHRTLARLHQLDGLFKQINTLEKSKDE